MEISNRSKLSLCQLLEELNRTDARLLLEKHTIATQDDQGTWEHQPWIITVRDHLLAAPAKRVGDLLQELVRTNASWRNNVSPRYLFDERWEDLTMCLELDGFAILLDDYGRSQKHFSPVEPQLEGVRPFDDELSLEIRRSGIPAAQEILDRLEASANAFRSSELNNCLANARIALETLVKSVAVEIGAMGDQADRFGAALAFLTGSQFIERGEEKSLSGNYMLVSPGVHRPVGFSEQEYVRFGRYLALSSCYFVIKKWNGSRHD
ncbi:MAG: hypothetical protein KUA43_11385 [Hoeflea sp.]|uniref:hypothetical protein n=1 Tax=Hoeflea sp. TaxID=1940281 RepID=UPI001D374CA4|nr:hypothetical protein [Hoeflea sp.]MBU4527613.1 hypothetical protein [Alphaproteobacteria bacterium]MBU4546519.1 hypothetical protein [Alphaproteobacteria bacterium]MBU4552963.1 hypothetical protein [Alphaproteobacteria bacterium]MBV1724035.1 hypothetical protein [Hoeflea sp.]MBV1759720.1 hypothetical protein [Hoeflea sp.]